MFLAGNGEQPKCRASINSPGLFFLELRALHRTIYPIKVTEIHVLLIIGLERNVLVNKGWKGLFNAEKNHCKTDIHEVLEQISSEISTKVCLTLRILGWVV